MTFPTEFRSVWPGGLEGHLLRELTLVMKASVMPVSHSDQ